MMFSSIRFKLTLWYTCVLAMIVSVFSIFSYILFVRSLSQQTDRNIAEISRSITASVRGEQDDSEEAHSPENAITEALAEFHSPDYSVVVLRPDGSALADAASLAPAILPVTSDGASFSRRINGKPFRIGRSQLAVGGSDYSLNVVYSLTDQRELEESVRNIFLASVPIALLLTAMAGYFLARRSLAPIAEMSSRAARINAANLSETLPVRNPNDEIGSLATVFNDLLKRLEREFDRQRRFVTDASHELRTPLAIIRGETDVALLDRDRAAAEYLDSIEVVNQESQRLSGIVEDLFTLARADSGGLLPELREIYVDEILGECVRAIRILADQKAISIQLDTHEILASGDESLLRRLFMNLLDNAIKYNYAGGSIRIVADHRSVMIGNTGKLIPEADVEHVFERFYRIDKGRNGDEQSYTSGAGLGLSISKVIADMHGAVLSYGHVGIENQFTVVFPDHP